MKKAIVLLGIAAVALTSLWVANSPSASAAQITAPHAVGDFVTIRVGGVARRYQVVENYSGFVETKVDMPGIDTANGVFYSGQQNITELTFAPGKVTYQGQNIDFSGLESQFIGPNYSGSMQLNLGPDHLAETNSKVTGNGDSASSGAVEASGTLTYKDVSVLAGTNKDNLALTIGSIATLTSHTSNWKSAVVPELDGRAVSTQCAVKIESLDAATGVIQRSFTGSILADATVIEPVEANSLVSLSTKVGSLLMALGFVFVGLITLPRNG